MVAAAFVPRSFPSARLVIKTIPKFWWSLVFAFLQTAPAANGPEALNAIIENRPVIGLFLYAGHPGIYAEGQDVNRDYTRALAVFDPFLSEDAGALQATPEPGAPLDPMIQSRTKAYQPSKLGYFRMEHAHMAMGCGDTTGCALPGWYLAKPDSWDTDSNGKKLAPCLANPDFAEPFRRYIVDVLGKVPDLSGMAMWYLESEPQNRILPQSVNPHTQQGFTEFLKTQSGLTVLELNQAAGASYQAFEDVKLSDKNWLVGILRMRYFKHLLYVHYQKTVVDLFHEAKLKAPVCTRWCELLGGSGFDDTRDASYFDQVPSDFVGITWYAGNAFLPHCQGNRGHLGKASCDMSFLMRYQRPIALVEFNSWRSHVSTWNGGPDMTSISPIELRNHVYRNLYYGVKLYSVFNWQQPGASLDWLQVHWQPELLEAVILLRAELDRIRPYTTFGRRLPNTACVLVSREAQGFPVKDDKRKRFGGNNHFYGDALYSLQTLMETPSLSRFDAWEEHASVNAEELSAYKGILVYDQCLSPKTREAVAQAAAKGTKVLALGGPMLVDARYMPATPPPTFPVKNVTAVEGEDMFSTSGDHPLLAGLNGMKMVAKSQLVPGDGATVLGTMGDKPGAVILGNIAWLGGLPQEENDYRKLLSNFLQWIGASSDNIYTAPFEKALVVQNFRSDKIRVDVDGQVAEPFPWQGTLVAPWKQSDFGQIYESRSDQAWLAWREMDGRLELLNVFLDSAEIKAFQPRKGKSHPHFTAITGPAAFRRFAIGPNRIRAWLRTSDAGKLTLTLDPGSWSGRLIAWQAASLAENKFFAKGETTDLGFSVAKNQDYLVEIAFTETKK